MKIIKKKNIFLFFRFLTNLTIFNLQANYTNNLFKIFHHIGTLEDKIVLYFDNNPMIKFNGVIKESPKKHHAIYNFSNSLISKAQEANDMIKKINNNKHPFYKISLTKNPKKSSIQIKFSYDPNFVKNIELMSFNSISLFKGITFNITHKDITGLIKVPSFKIGSNFENKKPNIILDLGHGGSDTGAIGVNGIAEKSITFEIGNRLKNLLNKKYNVFLTRKADEFVALDKRTTMANLLPGPSIFISIHANHSQNENAAGLETFYIDSTLFNKFNFKNNITTTMPVLSNTNDKKNLLFATTLHNNLFQTAKAYNKNLIDRKLKKSISQVILGTQMPSALIELGFVSNKNECDLLCSAKYQDVIAKGISLGIDNYFKSINNF